MSSIIFTGYSVIGDLPARALGPTSYEIVSIIEQPASGESEPLYTSTATNTTPTNRITLALTAHSLQPARSYRFRLQATDIMNQVGFAEIDIHTESLPLFGSLDVTPRAGDSLRTLFRLSALGWTDDVGDAPFSFQYGFQFNDNNEETVYWLTGILSQDYLTTLLPPASWGGLSVVLSVYDRNGAVARRKVQVDLDAEVGTNESTQLSDIMEEIENKAVNFGNWVEGLADLMALAIAINENEYFMYSSDDAMEVRRKGVELITFLYWSQIPASKPFLDQLLLLLSELTRDVAISDVTASELASTLNSIILQYVDVEQSSAVASRPGFSAWALQTILDIYANLIAANSKVEGAGRIQEDTLTESLTHNVRSLGYGACLQLGLRERQVTAGTAGLGTLSVSLTGLPSAYTTIRASDCSNCSRLDEAAPTVSVNFGRHLYERYLAWPCSNNGSECTGVCLASAQFSHDLRWQGNQYTSFPKTPLLSLTLINPVDSSEITVKDLPSDSLIGITFPVTYAVSDPSLLACATWDTRVKRWSEDGCSTIIVSSSHAA